MPVLFLCIIRSSGHAFTFKGNPRTLGIDIPFIEIVHEDVIIFKYILQTILNEHYKGLTLFSLFDDTRK